MRLELLSANWDKLCLGEHVILWQSAAIQVLADDEPESLQLPANGVIPWAQVMEGYDLGL